MLYNFTFLLSSLFFFFLKIWSEIGMRIIHGRALYTGKYGTSRCHKSLSCKHITSWSPIPVPDDFYHSHLNVDHA